MLLKAFEYHLQDYVNNEEVGKKIQDAIENHDNLSDGTVIFQDDSVRASKRNKKERNIAKEAGRQYERLDRTGVWQLCQSS